MRQGMSPLKHSRSRPSKMLDAADGGRRRKQQMDLWKAKRREAKYQQQGR